MNGQRPVPGRPERDAGGQAGQGGGGPPPAPRARGGGRGACPRRRARPDRRPRARPRPAPPASSRRSSRGASSRTARCRARHLGGAGGGEEPGREPLLAGAACARRTAARRASPSPKRSRSCAYGWSRVGEALAGTPCPRSGLPCEPARASWNATARRARSRARKTRSCATTSATKPASGASSQRADAARAAEGQDRRAPPRGRTPAGAPGPPSVGLIEARHHGAPGLEPGPDPGGRIEHARRG